MVFIKNSPSNLLSPLQLIKFTENYNSVRHQLSRQQEESNLGHVNLPDNSQLFLIISKWQGDPKQA